MPTLREVLFAAGREDRMEDAAGALGNGVDTAPWYVRLAVGAGTWVGALCVGFALMASGLAETASISIVVGLLLISGAVFVSRKTRWIATPQIVLVSSLGGQALVLLHVLEGFDQTGVFLLIALVQVALLFAIEESTHRFLSASATVVALWAAFEPPDALALLAPAVALAVAVELLLRDTRLASANGSGWSRPAAYGVSVAVLGIHILQALWITLESTEAGFVPFLSVESVLIALAAIAVGVRVALRAGAEAGWPEGRARVATAVAMLVTVALSLRVPGLAVAFVLLVAAHARGERVLTGLTCAGLAVFFGVFYYSLQLTLLEKSAWLGGTGAVFLGLYVFGFRADAGAAKAAARQSLRTRGGMVIAATALATLLLAGGLAASRESIRRSGTRVLLALAPVDPRSLIQGDYMVLDYELNRQLTSALQRPRTGDAVALLRLDASGIGTLVTVDPQRAPGANEALVRVRIRDYRARIGAESFFFEEGQARLYEAAKYAELRVSSSGVVLLTGLLDAALEPIGERR